MYNNETNINGNTAEYEINKLNIIPVRDGVIQLLIDAIVDEKRKGKTYQEIADKAGVSVSYLRRFRYFDVPNPQFEFILRLMKALDITCIDIF